MNDARDCFCDKYPESIAWDPNAEERLGRIRILDTTEPGWSMAYRVECVACGRRFTVKQVDGPALRWKWVPQGVKRNR